MMVHKMKDVISICDNVNKVSYLAKVIEFDNCWIKVLLESKYKLKLPSIFILAKYDDYIILNGRITFYGKVESITPNGNNLNLKGKIKCKFEPTIEYLIDKNILAQPLKNKLKVITGDELSAIMKHVKDGFDLHVAFENDIRAAVDDYHDYITKMQNKGELDIGQVTKLVARLFIDFEDVLRSKDD